MSNIDNTANENRDVYASVTSHIINAIELAVGNWRMPWPSGCFAFSPINVASNKPYRGINVVGLWAALCQPLDRVTPDRSGICRRTVGTIHRMRVRTKGGRNQWKSSDLR